MGTVERWTGREVRALRDALKMSVRDFATHTNLATSTITDIEAKGEHANLRRGTQRVLDEAFATAPQLVQQRFQNACGGQRSRAGYRRPAIVTPTDPDTKDDLPPGSLDAVEGEPIDAALVHPEPPDTSSGWMVNRLEMRRRRVLASVSVGAVSGAGLQEWERTVLRHGRATRYLPAWRMLIELDADLADLQRALAGHHTSSSLRLLTRATAQLAGLVFLTLIKLNQPGSARAWARTARVAADEAGDPATSSWVWAQEAYVHFYDGHLAEAVEVARHAQELAGRGAAVGVPLAAALQARALAALGQRQEALAAIGRANAALTRLKGDLAAPSAFGYNEAQLRFHEGNALTHLRDTEAAQASQQQALDLYPDDDFLDRTLVHLDQAFCLAYAGHAEAAAQWATRALTDLTDQQRAGLVTVRARELLAALPSENAATAAVRELRDHLPAAEIDRERTRP